MDKEERLLKVANEYRDGLLTYQEFFLDMECINRFDCYIH